MSANAPPPAPTATPSYSVAEWGVLIYDADGGELTSGLPLLNTPKPPQPDMTAVPKKPVIYLRPGDGWELDTDIKVTVTMGSGGRLHEVWPTPSNGAQPAQGAASFSWTVAGISTGACAAGWGPRIEDAPCSSLPRPAACEAAEFEAWVPSSAVCLDVGGVAAPALLYNGLPEAANAPVSVKDGYRNTSRHAVGPVFVVNRDVPSRFQRIERIEAGATERAGDASVDREALLKAVRGELVKLGLTASEAADFMRAWTPLLSDANGWTAFGFFDPEGIEAVSTLSFEPSPAQVYRVMAFAIAK